jgi:hypothetical protein
MADTTERNPGADRLRKEAMRHGAGDAEAGLDRRDAAAVLDLVGGNGLGTTDRDAIYEAYSTSFDAICRREVLVDAASAMSFPASDPPSYMGGASVAGAPDTGTPAEKVTTEVSDEQEVAPLVGDPDSAGRQAP